jgi:transposase-like protein
MDFWTEMEARAVIAAWRKSGLSMTDYAREHDVGRHRIVWWLKKLEGRNGNDAVKLLPVRVVETAAAEPVSVVLRSGHTVRVARGFDEDTLLRVVTLLEAR